MMMAPLLFGYAIWAGSGLVWMDFWVRTVR